MPNTLTCTWTGASGKQYDYHVYKIPAVFDPGQIGNYIYAKVNENNNWVPIYIGEGDLKERANLDRHHQGECIKRKGATHFHCHLNPVKEARLAEEADLLAGHPEAYVPTGCNIKIGG